MGQGGVSWERKTVCFSHSKLEVFEHIQLKRSVQHSLATGSRQKAEEGQTGRRIKTGCSGNQRELISKKGWLEVPNIQNDTSYNEDWKEITGHGN